MNREFFNILIKAAVYATDGDVRRCYSMLNIVMRRTIESLLAGSRIHFGGLFAKIDFLCKEHDVNKSLAYAVNNLRHRIKDIVFTSDEELQAHWDTDLEALAKFISIITDTDIPSDVKAYFPKKHTSEKRQKIIQRVMRMVVKNHDNLYIYGTIDGLGDTRVGIPAGWEYISQLLDGTVELNIINPRHSKDDENTLIPELIIFQPDYLIDISTVAGCFESYADTPYAALLNRLRCVQPTRAIHLGNLASQFLDEELHGSKRTYAESVMHFFRHHALGMAAAEGIDGSFHDDAKAQRENIRIAVRELLEKEVGQFNASQALLEPSFFCETLGLQGRMDMLQKDYGVLIEQKSGKGGFPQPSPDVPVYQEMHYVQMLLYMALLHYGYTLDGKDIPNSHIQSFLLYSKYRQGLIRLSAAPELLHRAIQIRNQLAWCELSYTRGGADILLKMTPEKLLRKSMRENFWQTYIRPQLAEVLNPIHNATPLEKAYFLRMMQFVATEHTLAKMGNNTKENSGFAAKWQDSLTDKLMAGSILHELSISGFCHDDGQTTELTLTAATTDFIMAANFRKGDIVVLYPYEYNREPDIRQGMVHRCTIKSISINTEEITIILRLKSPQTDPTIFNVRKGWQWAVEHDFYESSSTAGYRNLHMFLCAPQGRKDLLLGLREPQTDKTLTLKGDYGQFNDLVLRAKQAQDLFLVIGPPGTGKTSFGLMNILKEHLAEGASVLLMAYTNRAVDEICGKLCEDSTIDDFVRLGSPLSCEEAYRPFLLEEKCASCRNIGEIRALIQDTQIFVGTTTAMSSAMSELFRLKTFDIAIIDEASQILEPYLLGLLSATSDGKPAIRKFILIGDHKQLPAVVAQSAEESAVDNPLLLDIGLTNCQNSLFERLLNRFRDHSYLLRNQGRMHPSIADFPNTSFYNGELGIAGLPHQLSTDVEHRIVFVAVKSPDKPVSDKVNENEANVIAKMVYEIYESSHNDFDAHSSVGIIVPYRNQITAIRKALGRYHVSDFEDITIDTVERYQGSQRDTIIYGFTVQYAYQLSFLSSSCFMEQNTTIDRRLNVALTRARKREVIVGNPDILKNNAVFQSLIEYCRQHDCYTDAE